MSIPFLALPGRLGQRAIRVDDRLVEERGGLRPPHPQTALVDRGL
jgi:hypothetical protein